jgi:hypothetical protein
LTLLRKGDGSDKGIFGKNLHPMLQRAQDVFRSTSSSLLLANALHYREGLRLAHHLPCSGQEGASSCLPTMLCILLIRQLW